MTSGLRMYWTLGASDASGGPATAATTHDRGSPLLRLDATGRPLTSPSTTPARRPLVDTLRPGAVRRGRSPGFEGAGILVRFPDGGGDAEAGRVPGHARSGAPMKPVHGPSR